MDNKEALKVLENLSVDYNGMDDDEIAEMDSAVDFAIAALEEKVASQLQDCKQVGGDLVSRSAVIDALDNLDYMPGEWSVRGLSLCKDAIKALPPSPSRQAEPHWIPCKDRMPDKDGDYIVSGKWEDGEISVGECDYSTEDGYFNASWRFTVLAWMEKPEPYMEVDDGTI